MKSLKALFLSFLFWGLQGQAVADPQDPTPTNTPAPSTTPAATSVSSSSAFSPNHLRGHWALGVSTLSYVGTALSVRYWYHEDEAYEFLVGGYDTPGSGRDFNNNFLSTPSWSFGASVGLRHNLLKPAEDVYVQWLARLSYSQNYLQSANTNNVSTLQNQDLVLFVGPGFEAFVPFWKNLSIDGNIGLYLDSHWNQNDTTYNPNNYTVTPPTSATSWTWGFGWSNSITSILNASVHFYF